MGRVGRPNARGRCGGEAAAGSVAGTAGVSPVSKPQADHQKSTQASGRIPADFIGAIYQHALCEISTTVPKDYFESCVKEFVVTVPAIWSDLAKDATRKVRPTMR